MASPENPLSFNSVNQAIEQRALSDKLSGLQQKRQNVYEWAIQDALSKGLAPEETSVIISDYYATPSVDQLRAAGSLQVDTDTGATLEDFSQSLRQQVEATAEASVMDVEVPEVRPVFRGIRRIINNVRLKRTERKIENIIDETSTRAHIGTIALRSQFGEGYHSYADDGILKAPDSKRDDEIIRGIEKQATKRHIRKSRVSRLGLLVKDSPRTSRRKRGNRIHAQAVQAKRAEANERNIHELAFDDKELENRLGKAVKKRAKLRAKKVALG